MLELREEPGTDITGEGDPDVVVWSWSGGAHCCFSTVVYNLGDVLTKVLETPSTDHCAGKFKDLDDDGIPEFMTCDDRVGYRFGCLGGSVPLAPVVLRYEPGRGYVTATPRFAHVYAEWLTRDQDPREISGGACDVGMSDHKCHVLQLVLDYLYTGQPDQARAAFEQFYRCPDAEARWEEAMNVARDSPLYAPAGAPKPAIVWSHYMLELMAPDDGGPAFVALREAYPCYCESSGVAFTVQDTCMCLGTFQLSLEWLEGMLRNTDLLAENESLQFAPQGCMRDCRIVVVTDSGDAPVGEIHLDVSAGFPGQVYRTGAGEPHRWRLKEDLMWEQVE